MSLFDFKKWYFDVVTEQGDVLYAYFITYRLAGIGRGVVSAHLVTAAGGRHIRDSVTTRYRAAGENGRVHFRGGVLDPARDGVRILLDLPRIKVDLQYISTAKGWRPNGKGVLLTSGRKTLSWEVPQIRASVSGKIDIGQETIDVRGTGYHDFVHTDIPPWRLPLSELLWGRVHFPRSTLVFNQVKMRERNLAQNILVKRDGYPPDPPAPAAHGHGWPRLRWIDDYEFLMTDSGTPGEAVLSHTAFSLSLKERKVLEESPVSTSDRIRFGPFRRTLDRLSGRPEERKIFSEARLDMSGFQEHGLAIHERILWHWNRGQEGSGT